MFWYHLSYANINTLSGFLNSARGAFTGEFPSNYFSIFQNDAGNQAIIKTPYDVPSNNPNWVKYGSAPTELLATGWDNGTQLHPISFTPVTFPPQ